MESIDLGTLIVGAVIGVGVIELIIWILVVIRDPGYDYLRPDLIQASATQASVADSSQRSHPSAVGK